MAFENIKELNRIQSVVFQTAYNTNENLLICAPTGAGKTNIALLTVVHQIKQHIENDVIMKNKFKVSILMSHAALSSATQNAIPSKFGGKWGSECLNTSFPLPTLQCAGYSVKLIYINITNFS